MAGRSHNQSSHSSINTLPPWGLKEVFSAFFLGFFMVSIIISILFSTLFADVSQFVKIMTAHLASYLVWIMILVTLAKKYGSEAFSYLGLKFEKSWFSYIFDGFFCGGAILLVGWVIGFVAQTFHLPYRLPLQDFPENQLRLIAMLAIFTAPFLEEIAFRGFLQVGLYRYMKPPAAIIITALLFTLFHSLYYGQWLALAYVAMMGIVLGLFRYFTGSTIPCIMGHFINNVLAAFVLLH